LSGAARRQQRVRLRYRSAEQAETERDVDVYGLAYRGGGWYAVGHCHLRRDLRSFRLDRVQAVEALPVSFGRPEGFDVLGYLKDRHRRAAARLCGGSAAGDRPGQRAPLGLRRDGPAEATPRGVLLRVQADDLEWVARELARLPFGFRIVKPVALKRALVVQAERMLRPGRPDRLTPHQSCSRQRAPGAALSPGGGALARARAQSAQPRPFRCHAPTRPHRHHHHRHPAPRQLRRRDQACIIASREPDMESFFFMADYHALIKSDDPERIERSRCRSPPPGWPPAWTPSARSSTARATSPRSPS
jgi:hypothetical protein